jgi:hypothetical protein
MGWLRSLDKGWCQSARAPSFWDLINNCSPSSIWNLPPLLGQRVPFFPAFGLLVKMSLGPLYTLKDCQSWGPSLSQREIASHIAFQKG